MDSTSDRAVSVPVTPASRSAPDVCPMASTRCRTSPTSPPWAGRHPPSRARSRTTSGVAQPCVAAAIRAAEMLVVRCKPRPHGLLHRPPGLSACRARTRAGSAGCRRAGRRRSGSALPLHRRAGRRKPPPALRSAPPHTGGGRAASKPPRSARAPAVSRSSDRDAGDAGRTDGLDPTRPANCERRRRRRQEVAHDRRPRSPDHRAGPCGRGAPTPSGAARSAAVRHRACTGRVRGRAGPARRRGRWERLRAPV